MLDEAKTELDAIYGAAKEQESRLASNDFSSDTWQKKEGYKISDPVRLLTIYDPAIRNQTTRLHAWQVKVMLTFAYRQRRDVVHRICVRANNGSGKSQYCVAPCSIWLCMAHIRARAVVTSASGTQLDRQAAKKIVNIAQQVNELHGQILWKINYRFLTFLPTGSTIELYATDDPGKAEGYHPHDDGAEFAIFVDEAKSVGEPIYDAISRCNGLTRRMDVSSPGGLIGHFYSINFSERWIRFVITYKDCPHILPDEVEEAKERYGENSPWFRSAYLAEFTSVEQTVIITWDALQKCLREALQYAFKLGPKFGGLDLAKGGDENVLTIFQGNVQLSLDCFRYDDATVAVDYIKKLLLKYDVDPANVNADDGGLGSVMIDMLWRDGFKVHRVRNDSAAFNNDLYANRGAEMWLNFSRFVIESDVVLINDATLINQLSSRYYKKGDTLGKITLESKRIARAQGHGSPDRADGTVLAFARKSYPLIREFSDVDLKTQKRPTTEALIEEVLAAKRAYSGIDAMISGGSGTGEPLLDYGELANN